MDNLTDQRQLSADQDAPLLARFSLRSAMNQFTDDEEISARNCQKVEGHG
jgi:hypothetical protein